MPKDVACVIIRAASGAMVMVQTARTRKNREWEFPGGGIEEREVPLEAAQRELWEETGIVAIDLTPVDVVERRTPHGHFVYFHYFTLILPERVHLAPQDNEIKRIGWHPRLPIKIDERTAYAIIQSSKVALAAG